MWKVLVTAIEMLIYASIYIIFALVAVKIVTSTFATDFEKKISDENNVALAIICASLFLGIAILLASITK